MDLGVRHVKRGSGSWPAALTSEIQRVDGRTRLADGGGSVNTAFLYDGAPAEHIPQARMVNAPWACCMESQCACWSASRSSPI